MPDPQSDPLDALRSPITPLAPDAAFAADLRDQLVRVVPTPPPKEPPMNTETTTRPRNGVRNGDVSYITLGLPDLAQGKAFYGAVLGWHLSSSEHGSQVDDIVPMMGLWGGDQPAGGRMYGAVLAFRVDNVTATVAAVRAHGGTISDPHREPYAMTAEGHDDQGIPFYLHEMPSITEESAPGDGEFHNGEIEGDVSYLTMVVPNLDAARAFYGGVFAWTFSSGPAEGAQVTGVAPQIGMATQPEAGPAIPGVIVCYRVDDIAAAVQRVRDAGGEAREVAERSYGLESLCADDQGTPFYLHQF
jgi:predicted enzyme related to lactoylglutathione lyase